MSKLVRDKIPDIIRQKGKVPVTHTAEDDEYWDKLQDKLKEEVHEFLKDGEVDELVDVLEVVYALAVHKGIHREELETIRRNKADARGQFKKKIILDEAKFLH